MAETQLGILNTNNPIRADTSAASELNSLVQGGVALCGIVLSNVQNDAAGLGYPEVKGKLSLGSAAFVSPAAVYGWLLQADDGTNYETYVSGTSTTSAPVAREPDFIWPVEGATQACIRDAWAARGAPLCAHMKLLVWNMSGVALAASGNSVNLYYSTGQLQP